jgi:bifunctional non-homologous end joining protein LigD
MPGPGLPDALSPMLARTSEPFDSDRHLFEIKWDGLRALAFVEAGAWRIRNRNGVDVTSRHPELEGLARVPTGTILDGEIVVLRDGRPDFQALQSRWNVDDPLRLAPLVRSTPVTYVVFDLPYAGGEPLLDRPLEERRARLEELVAGLGDGRLVFSDGVQGSGQAYFREAAAQGLEGVMAKRLGSRYLPGRRGDAWLKIKCRRELLCAIIGYLPEGEGDFKSLIVAAPDEGRLRCVGRVGSGIDLGERRRLMDWLRRHPRSEPLVPCDLRGRWVEPGLACRVTYHERTRSGDLRAPVFVELVET